MTARRTPHNDTPPTLRAIASLTAALVAQDTAADATAAARRRLIRQAIDDGYTLTAIGDASGITRQRVAQLAQPEGGRA